MSAIKQRISPFLWFNDNAEAAVNFYVGVFRNSKVGAISRYTKESSQPSGQPAGSIMTIAFTLDGQEFTAINGGPQFHFTEAISLMVRCRNQEEIDYYWNKLSQGGDAAAQMCGWLKDRYGLSWQVVPEEMIQLVSDPEKGGKVMAEVLKMKKLDLARLEQAAA
jgi:predicted 3-demethylubiquinone-9 3-methyltransferase (glyoxalase superfamily)